MDPYLKGGAGQPAGSLSGESAISPDSTAPARVPIPDLRELAMGMGQAARIQATSDRSPTEQNIWQEQTDAATLELASPDPERRISGAQQLGAYPGADSSKRLVEALSRDPSADVRQAAAEAFAHWPDPSPDVIRALLKAVSDPYTEVRRSALMILETQLGSRALQPRQRQQLIGGMRQLTKLRSIDKASRKELQRILSEQ